MLYKEQMRELPLLSLNKRTLTGDCTAAFRHIMGIQREDGATTLLRYTAIGQEATDYKGHDSV